MKRKTNERAAHSPKNAACTTNDLNITTPKAHGTRARVPLTPEQRGRFWTSVGEAIEAARVRIGGGL